MPDFSFDFRLFRYALSSAEHGSFRRAAAALNVQQSTVSRGVRSLEHRIGAELFERSHAGIRPTATGERFLKEAAQGFDHLEHAVQRVGAAQRGEHGQLTVATNVPFVLLGDIFERFRNEHPGVSLEIVEGTCSGSALLVRQWKADLAFVTNFFADHATQSLHLRDEPMIAVLARSHPLANARSLMLEELRGDRFILSTGGLGPAMAELLKHEMARSNSNPDLQLLQVDQCSIISMVASGFGVTIMIGRLPQAGLDDVVLIPLSGSNTVPIQAVWRASTANPALEFLLKIVREIRSSATAN